MDDLELLRRNRPAVAPPDEAVIERAEQSLMALIEAISPTPRHGTTVPPEVTVKRRWTGVLRVAAVAATSVAVAIGTGVLPGNAPSAAAGVLLATAERAAALDSPTAAGVHYSRSEGLRMQEGLGGTHGRYSVMVNTLREVWWAPDGSGRARTTVGEHTFPSDADRQRWELAGRPPVSPFSSGTRDRSYGPGEMPDYELTKLNTDVGALRKQLLRRYGNDRGDRVSLFVAIGDLLRGTPASPALRSALYRLAADISGVKLLGSTIDHHGRPGVAVAMTSDYSGVNTRYTMIFDPEDGTLLEEQELVLERAPWTPTAPPLPASVVTYLESTTVESIPPTPAIDEAQVAALVERCLGATSPGEPADDYLGLSSSKLREKTRADGLTHRLLGRDDDCRPHTDDLQPNRLNVFIIFDQVVWARRF